MSSANSRCDMFCELSHLSRDAAAVARLGRFEKLPRRSTIGLTSLRRPALELLVVQFSVSALQVVELLLLRRSHRRSRHCRRRCRGRPRMRSICRGRADAAATGMRPSILLLRCSAPTAFKSLRIKATLFVMGVSRLLVAHPRPRIHYFNGCRSA